MKRPKTQVLYRFLPSMFVDFHKCIVQITKWDCNVMENINKTRIVYKIHRNVNSFRRFNNAKGFPLKPNPDEYVILEPRRVEGRVRPLTFLCNNGKCNAAFSFYPNESSKVIRKFGTEFKCPKCKSGNIFQWDMIYHDTDGKLEQVDYLHYLYSKKITDRDNVKLLRHGKKPSQWRWRDTITGNEESLNKRNFETNHIMYPKPFRISSVINLHGEEFINVSEEDEEIIFSSQDAAKLKIAEYLGLLEEKNTTLKDMLKTKGSLRASLETSKTVEMMRKAGVDEKTISKMLETLRKENPSEHEKKMEILEQIENMVKPTSENYANIALEVFDYLETLSLPNKKEIREVVREAEIENKPNVHIIKKFPNVLERIGVEKAFIARDLTILSTIYGFTRKENEPDKAVLNRFHTSLENDGEDEIKTPIFAVRKKTEAIIFQFDRMKILKWLAENGVKIEFEKLKDERSLKCWFLNNIENDKIDRFFQIGNDANLQTRLVYNLLHTISHALLIQASFQCGYEKDSLGEIILPTIPAIILYYKTANDFQLGGMYTLFENFIIPWIDDAKELVKSCIYDPLCKNDKGACHACLHISEGSCQHFNKDLGRHYLIGRKKDGICGFWESSFLKKLRSDENGL